MFFSTISSDFCDELSEGTFGSLWYFPDGLYLLIPLSFSWVAFFFLLLEHILNLSHSTLWQFRFQALYVRLVSFFPIFALMATLCAFWPRIAIWIDVGFSFMEPYMLTCVFALITGFGWIKTDGHFPEVAILQSPKTNRLCQCCGSEFSSGESALKVWKGFVLQFVLIKPCTTIFVAIIEESGKDNLKGALIALNVIGTLSLIFSLLAIFRVYFSVREAPGAPLQGQRGFGKLLTIKILFTFIVLNRILVTPLINLGVIPVTSFFCSSNVLECYEEWCHIRFISVVLLMETVLLSFPAFLHFRHHPLQTDQTEDGDIISYEKSVGKFIVTIFHFFDLNDFWNGHIIINSDTEVHRKLFHD
jgi:hypothetical protein